MQMRTFSHEMDHALKLQHPHDVVENYYPYAVMCQGDNTESTFYPTGHDKAALIAKWGA